MNLKITWLIPMSVSYINKYYNYIIYYSDQKSINLKYYNKLYNTNL